MENMSRRGLFKAFPSFLKENIKQEKGEITRIRPPYTGEKSDFNLCRSCEGSCVIKCEENVLFRDRNGIPYIEFKNSGCTFCKECLNACQYGVLNNPENEMIHAITTINQSSCLAWNKTMCFSCKDYCLEDAIKFMGLFNPQVIASKCTNCGFCVVSCPVKAIEIRGKGHENI